MQKTLILEDHQARKLYPTATPDIKAILETTFGKEFFSASLLDRCTTFEAVCAERGIDPSSIYSSSDKPHIAALKRLEFTIEVLNDDPSFPNWDDEDQYKWYSWFYHNSPSGFRFGDSGFDVTGSRVGSRLCLKSEKLVQHMVKYFFEDYKLFHTKS